MSKFNFHRTFKNITGNTLNKYIKRICLEKSINFIYYAPCVSITDVAMRLGYSTASNFTKAFNKIYRKRIGEKSIIYKPYLKNLP